MHFFRNRKQGPSTQALLGLLLFGVVALVATTVRLPGAAAETPSLTSPIPDIALVTSSDQAVEFIVDVPPLQRIATMIDGQSAEKLLIDGYSNSGDPGAPDLPVTSFWIAVPPGAVPVLGSISAETTTLQDVIAAPVTTQTLAAYDFDDPNATPTFTATDRFNRAVYAADRWISAEPVTLGEPVKLRDYTLVPVQLHPVQVNNATRQARVHSQITVSIQFDYPDGKRTPSTMRSESDTFTNLLRNTVLNFESGANWRTPYQAPQTIPPASPCLANSTLRSNAHRITLSETGMYVIYGSDLGAQPSVNSLRMCYEDSEIHIKVDDVNSNGTLNATDRIIFYGEAIKTHDIETNAYWLTYGSGSTLVMATADGTPASATVVDVYDHPVQIERDTLYYTNFPLNDPSDAYDHWFDGPLVAGDYVPLSYNATNGCATCSISKTFTVSDIDSGTAHIEVEVWGFRANDDHRYQVEINGTMVGSIATFTGSALNESGKHLFSADFDSSLLEEGSNSVTVRLLDNESGISGGLHTMILNWIHIDLPRELVAKDDRLAFEQSASGTWRYQADSASFTTNPLVFDVTDSLAPEQITGVIDGEFERANLVSTRFEMATLSGLRNTDNSTLQVEKDSASDLRATSNSADMIIITDPSLDSAMTPLVNRRTNQGMDVAVVYVQDIFDEFGYGRYSTQAIRDFLQYVYENWGGDRDYVLLAGDSSYDHRDVMGLNAGRNLVPVYLRSGIDTYIGEAAADNQYVAFESSGDAPENNLPFFLLGRLPASNSAEMSVMVQKILTYEDAPAASWQSNHVFATDNYRLTPDCETDGAGDFHNTVDTFVSEKLAQGQQAQKIYYAPLTCYPETKPYYERTVTTFKNEVINAFRSGAQHIIYTGHSGITNWGHENYFQVPDVPLLDNAGKLPIMLPMTCLEGQTHRFDLGDTSSNGLSEALVKKSGGGAVAGYAPTGLQVQTGHDFLIAGYYDALFTDHVATLGEAIYEAKLNLAAQGPATTQDLHDTFMLIGDPSLQLNLWRPSAFINLPTIMNP
ncbi:MAG: C25 family cysteine peptidase [Anaerolineae bacterium]|nr:C25 family cysteine peptidase [Anaerolineae bacterium]